MTIPTDNPRPKPTPRPPKPSPGQGGGWLEKSYILGQQPKPHPVETQEFAAILTGVRERLARLEEAESVLSDIHDQLEKTGEVSPMTAARLRIFMEGNDAEMER